MARDNPSVFDDLLREEREFPPSPAFRERAVIRDRGIYDSSAKDAEAFWENEAKLLHWFQPWTKVLEWTPPHARWFVGGTTNISYNCLDRHLQGPRRNKAALIWEGENGDIRTLTYLQLHREVCKFANCLKELGVTKGDRVAIYMPLLLETAVSMLACARIGAIHNVVFGGFSPDALADRINDSGCKVLITADGGWRRGTVVPLKHNADRALESCPTVEHVIIVKQLPGEPHLIHITEGRDRWYHRMMDHQKADCPAVPLDSEDTLFILYTSGTTGKPKGIVHAAGGYAVGVHTTARYRLRSSRRGHLLVHGGRGLGHRPQLRGVRTAPGRGHGAPLRGGARFPGEGPVLGDDRAPPRVGLLHGAHRHPLLHEVGRRAARAARPVQPPAPRHRGRAHQPRGVDVVPRAHRPRELPHRGHVVADGDRRDHDQRAARGLHDEAGLCRHAAPGHFRDRAR